LLCSLHDLFSGMGFLKVSGISKQEQQNFTVKHINFTQQSSQKIAIAGETGSGKTTLLKIIAGLVQPDTGNVYFENKRVLGPFEKLIPGHPQIAYLSQHFELRNNYRVEEELESKNLLTEEEANTLYSVCQIEHLLKRKTDQLSGGERQRIVLARLLTTSPKLLLLDEPFSNLDTPHKNIIKNLIHEIGTKLGITCIMVSHDALDTLSWADTILVMKDGQIIQQGTPEQIYNQPVNEYCAGLFGEYNLISGTNSFFNIPGIERNKKRLLARPEHFKITSKDEDTVKGIIQHSSFCGSYYTVDVLTGGQLIRVNTNSNHFVKGDIVYLSLLPGKVWFV
jgi:ABC-type Fe3+/spermidine/putrescine transport system ATPase subunit